MPRTRGARLHASRDAILLGKILIVDAVDAERAFLHHAMVVVIFARTIGTGPGTELAADAGLGIDQHDAVLGPLIGGACRAHGNASRFLAMEAGAREMHDARLLILCALHLIAMDTVEPGSLGRCAVSILVVERRRIALRVPFLA